MWGNQKMAFKTGLVYDDVFLRHDTPAWHPEKKERLVSIINMLRMSPLWDKLAHILPVKATLEDISSVHTRDYLEGIMKYESGFIEPDTYISEGSIESALFAAGAVKESVDRCRKGEISRAFCAVRPPGHHAEADRAMGFCIFNNIAIGARHAQSLGYEKVFIVDFDVHHGNGTQHIFEEDDSVFYFSTHQFPHYPGTGAHSETGKGRGKGFTRNIPMMAGSGDREYLQVYNELLPFLLSDYNPDIIFVSAGYDICAGDPLSGMNVTEKGIRGIVKGILSCSAGSSPNDSGPPVVFALEGGYDLTALGKATLATISEMTEVQSS